MEYLLGIDIGTSACKAAISDRFGHIAADAASAYQVYYPHPGEVEQNPDEWWGAVCTATRACLERSGIDPREIVGVGVDGQSWSAVCVDKTGKVLCPSPIWMDTRSIAQCERIDKTLGGDRLFSVSGNPLTAQYVTGKIDWIRENLPDVYRATHKVLQSNSYIVYRLTGKATQDMSQGYGWHCYDIRCGVWNDDVRRELGIPESFLPDIYPCHTVVGKVSREAAALCGLAEGTPVVAGGLDAACAALGAGVIHNGETQEQGGQSGGMSICTDLPTADKRLILCSHVVPGKWLLQGGTTGGGGVFRWIAKEFGAYEKERAERLGVGCFGQFDAMAADVAPGSDGLIFLPYMAGERTPIWDANARGVFYGIDFSKTKGHFLRAAMEGVAFSLRHNLDVAESLGAKVSVLRATGGCANSRLWTQIKSDVTGKEIEVPESDNSTNLGAAILAGVGVGLWKDFDEAAAATVKVTRRHTPDTSNASAYDVNYRKYLDIYTKLKDIMNDNTKSNQKEISE